MNTIIIANTTSKINQKIEGKAVKGNNVWLENCIDIKKQELDAELLARQTTVQPDNRQKTKHKEKPIIISLSF